MSDESALIEDVLAKAEGIGIMTTRSLRQTVVDVMEGRRLLEDCESLKQDHSDFDTKEVLEFMQTNGITNPETAYNTLKGNVAPSESAGSEEPTESPGPIEQNVKKLLCGNEAEGGVEDE